MRTFDYLFGLSCVCMFFASCGYYQPVAYDVTTPNVPLLEAPGDFQAMVGIGTNHTEIQAAVSPLKHVSLMGNIYAGAFKQKSNSYGIGTYYRLNNRFLFELYALTGLESNSRSVIRTRSPLFSSTSYKDIHKLDNRYSYEKLQLNVGFHWNDRGTYIFSSGFTRTRNHSYDYTLYEYSRDDYDPYSLEGTTEHHFNGSMDMMDFSLGYSWHIGELKCQYQVTAFVGIGKMSKEEREMLYYRPVMGSLTLGWEFDNLKRRKMVQPSRHQNSSENNGI
jgi:hypothetical protein